MQSLVLTGSLEKFMQCSCHELLRFLLWPVLEVGYSRVAGRYAQQAVTLAISNTCSSRLLWLDKTPTAKGSVLLSC